MREDDDNVSRVTYDHRRITDEGQAVIEDATRVCREYARQGLTLILRQVYYIFIARDMFPESWRDAVLGTKNTQRNYKRLCKLLSDGRVAGLVDWDHIEDRGRRPVGGDYGYLDPAHRVSTVPDGYAITRWDGQPEYVEVWVEKESLAEVVGRPCRRWNVTSLACKGSPSTSVVHDAAVRLRRYERAGRKSTVVYLGDHDPTGLDISRDIQERLALFRSTAQVDRIALNMDQVEELNPPPSPVKVTDSRTNGYIDRFGTDECWELDAIEPAQLDDLVERAILSRLDMGLWRQRERQEERDLVELRALADNWQAVRDYMDDQGLIDYSVVNDADGADDADDPDEEDGDDEG